MNLRKRKSILGIKHLINNINNSSFFVLAQIDDLNQEKQIELYQSIRNQDLNINLVPKQQSNKLKSVYITQLLIKLLSNNNNSNLIDNNKHSEIPNEIFALRNAFNNNIVIIYSNDKNVDPIASINKVAKLSPLTLLLAKIDNQYITHTLLKQLLNLKTKEAISRKIVSTIITPIVKLQLIAKQITNQDK